MRWPAAVVVEGGGGGSGRGSRVVVMMMVVVTTMTTAAVAPVRRWILFLHERSGVSKRSIVTASCMIDGNGPR